MKSKDGGSRGAGTGRRSQPLRISPMPMEWMDPMSWRLPSGKALAEFALQAGFLAPLMLGGPSFKRLKRPSDLAARGELGKMEKRVRAADPAAADPLAIDPMAIDKMMEEPDRSGTFRQTR